MNRDPKKVRKPFTAEDFCFFVDHEANRPEARAAGAYMRLMKDDVLPSWAMFCFSDFKHAEPTQEDLCAIVGEDFILLAPVPIDGGFSGLLLAEHAVSGQEVQGTLGEATFALRIPEFEGFVIAKANCELDLATPPEGLDPPSV